MTAGFFITGTDTGIGKTLVACALLEAVRAAGRRGVGMKAVAAGSEGGRWADVDALVEASGVRAPPHAVNPYAFEPAVAPHLAARKAGIPIDLANIVAAFRELGALADVVVVEGAGGLLVPLGERETMADLARALRVPAILVVGMRLGCLNHALLTRAALASCGVPCAGWVANSCAPEMDELAGNVRTLAERLDCPLLGEIPYRPGLTPLVAARFIDTEKLLARHG